MSETDSASLYLLDELWQEDVEFEGTLVCPGCGTVVCSLGWSGEITAFEAPCHGCEGELASFSTVVVPTADGERADAPPTDEMMEYVTSRWERRLSEGISEEAAAQYERRGTARSGDHEGYPEMASVSEPVDQTEMFAQTYALHADRFGWSWEPSGEFDVDVS